MKSKIFCFATKEVQFADQQIEIDILVVYSWPRGSYTHTIENINNAKVKALTEKIFISKMMHLMVAPL